MGVYPPRFLFNVTIILEKEKYKTLNGTSVWTEESRMSFGPTRKVVSSEHHDVS